MFNIKSLIFLFCALSSCRTARTTEVAELNDDLNAGIYNKLVQEGNLQQALNLTCSKYALDCAATVIDNTQNTGIYAITSTLTNTMTLYPTAFAYLGMPHQGWLAAIFDHENVHRSQSTYIRHIVDPAQQRIGNYFYQAGLESEAWSVMLTKSEKYQLTCSMVIEIEENIYDFGKIIQFNGTRSPEGKYPMPNEMNSAILKRCMAKKNKS